MGCSLSAEEPKSAAMRADELTERQYPVAPQTGRRQDDRERQAKEAEVRHQPSTQERGDGALARARANEEVSALPSTPADEQPHSGHRTQQQLAERRDRATTVNADIVEDVTVSPERFALPAAALQRSNPFRSPSGNTAVADANVPPAVVEGIQGEILGVCNLRSDFRPYRRKRRSNFIPASPLAGYVTLPSFQESGSNHAHSPHPRSASLRTGEPGSPRLSARTLAVAQSDPGTFDTPHDVYRPTQPSPRILRGEQPSSCGDTSSRTQATVAGWLESLELPHTPSSGTSGRR